MTQTQIDPAITRFIEECNNSGWLMATDGYMFPLHITYIYSPAICKHTHIADQTVYLSEAKNLKILHYSGFHLTSVKRRP